MDRRKPINLYLSVCKFTASTKVQNVLQTRTCVHIHIGNMSTAVGLVQGGKDLCD